MSSLLFMEIISVVFYLPNNHFEACVRSDIILCDIIIFVIMHFKFKIIWILTAHRCIILVSSKEHLLIYKEHITRQNKVVQ